MQNAALQLDAVSKVYGSRLKKPVMAVKDMTLQIRPGEIIALLGSSGCGKTSTLRMIAGFEEVSGGTIRLGGRAIETLAPAQRGVAMAFEGYSLYPPLTVRENIGFALKSSRLGKAEIAAKVVEMAQLLEIESVLDRYPQSISGGEQQRASLGRALVRKAELTLLDEPMGQLEPQLRSVLRGRLKHYLREHGMTTVLVTHDQTEANALADRIAVMEGGILQQYATPAELKARPANVFVGTFIGEPPMNVIVAKVTESGDRIRFLIDPAAGVSLDYPLTAIPERLRRTLTARSEVIVGIRPHGVRFVDPAGGSLLAAKVMSNQWLGDQSHVAVEFAGATFVAVSHKPVAAAAGTPLSIAIAAEDLHIFDSATGAAIAHGGESL